MINQEQTDESYGLDRKLSEWPERYAKTNTIVVTLRDLLDNRLPSVNGNTITNRDEVWNTYLKWGTLYDIARSVHHFRTKPQRYADVDIEKEISIREQRWQNSFSQILQETRIILQKYNISYYPEITRSEWLRRIHEADLNLKRCYNKLVDDSKRVDDARGYWATVRQTAIAGLDNCATNTEYLEKFNVANEQTKDVLIKLMNLDSDLFARHEIAYKWSKKAPNFTKFSESEILKMQRDEFMEILVALEKIANETIVTGNTNGMSP